MGGAPGCDCPGPHSLREGDRAPAATEADVRRCTPGRAAMCRRTPVHPTRCAILRWVKSVVQGGELGLCHDVPLPSRKR
jgi:hypothetical protein